MPMRGMSKLGALFFVTIFGSVTWVFYHVIPFYYSFYEIEGQMEALAVKASLFSDSYIQQELMRFIKKLDIPVDNPEDIKINRFEGKILIDLKYQEYLTLELGEGRDYDLWIFDFNPHVEHEF